MSTTKELRVGVDPGVRKTAVCVTIDGVVRHCALVRHGRNPAVKSKEMDEILGLVEGYDGPKRATIEMPRYYRDRNKTDPNDLLDLAAVAGEWLTILTVAGVSAEYAFPAKWKGQVPKTVTQNRVKRELSATEWKVVVGATRGSTADHNVIDAVGIALYKTPRSVGR